MSPTSPRVGRLFASLPCLSPAAIALAALLGAPIAPAQAEVITLRFEATVQFSSIVGGAFAGTVIGDTIFQDLTYDTSEAPFAVFGPPSPSAPFEAHYQPIHALTSAGRNGQLLVSGAIEPGSLPNFETYVGINDQSGSAQVDGFRAITYFPALRFYIQLPVPYETFSSIALPNFAPPLFPAPNTVLVISISGASTDEYAYGVLTRVTLIPAPGCSLLATALVTATLRRRRPPTNLHAGVEPQGTVGQVC